MIWRMCLLPLLIRGTFLWEHPFCAQVVLVLPLAFLRNSKAVFMFPVIHRRGLSRSLRHVLAWKWNRSKWSRYLEGNLMLVFRNSHYFPFKKNQPPNPTFVCQLHDWPEQSSLAWGPGPKRNEAEQNHVLDSVSWACSPLSVELAVKVASGCWPGCWTAASASGSGLCSCFFCLLSPLHPLQKPLAQPSSLFCWALRALYWLCSLDSVVWLVTVVILAPHSGKLGW